MTVVVDLPALASLCDLSAGERESLAEAARVMLHRHESPAPAPGQWKCEACAVAIEVHWAKPSERELQTHGNEKDATERGAYAVAAAALARLGFTVMGRTGQGSGSDWWMVRADEGEERLYKLEVSGIGKGGSPGTRLREKVAQGQRGTLRRPGVALVFRFADALLLSEGWA